MEPQQAPGLRSQEVGIIGHQLAVSAVMTAAGWQQSGDHCLSPAEDAVMRYQRMSTPVSDHHSPVRGLFFVFPESVK